MAKGSLFLSSILLASAGKIYSPGGLLVSGGKVVYAGEKQTASLFAPAGADRVELPGTVIFPGFVNAHTHLTIPELKWRAGGDGKDFVGWLLEVMRYRGESGEDDIRECVRESLRQSIESGITLAGEVTGGGLAPYEGAKIRLRVYFELLGMTEERWRETKNHIETCFDTIGGDGELLRPGISPHSLYTCSRAALSWAGAFGRERNAPLQIHFAESAPEMEFLQTGGGEIKERIYAALAISDGGFSGYGDGYTDTLTESIPPGGGLVHGTLLSGDQIHSLGNAGYRFVLCLRSNRYLTGAVPRVEDVVDGGHPFGIGTDSRGSCGRIDMFEEMRCLADAYHGSMRAGEFYGRLFDGATEGGAKIVGFNDLCGSLEEGRMADFCALEISPDKDRVLSRIIEQGEGRDLVDVFVSGESVIGY
ncbi:MAG: amidohydrolase family protein [Deltaproteobacteria bacterium]|nr:amidohydrolase family protein [Deltaproteobacteria bacterium]NIS77066.1 amidohydrolase family protein [Deltaproteobacteria bacterium]